MMATKPNPSQAFWITMTSLARAGTQVCGIVRTSDWGHKHPNVLGSSTRLPLTRPHFSASQAGDGCGTAALGCDLPQADDSPLSQRLRRVGRTQPRAAVPHEGLG